MAPLGSDVARRLAALALAAVGVACGRSGYGAPLDAGRTRDVQLVDGSDAEGAPPPDAPEGDGADAPDARCTDELCNGVDDDCDGTIDEGAGPELCPGGGGCASGRCSVGGAQVSARSFGGAGSDMAQALAVGPSGEIVLAGTTLASGIDFGGGARTVSGERDAFVAVLDSDGGHGWDRVFGGAGSDSAYAVAALADGRVVVAGTASAGIDLGDGPRDLGGASDGAFAAVYDAGGALLWGYTRARVAFGALAATDSAIFVAGPFSGPVDFGGGVRTPGPLGVGDIVVRLSLDGAHESDHVLADGARFAPLALVAGPGDRLVVAGSAPAGVDLGGGPRDPGNSGLGALALGTDWAYRWDYMAGGSSLNNMLAALTVPPSGGLLAVGRFGSTVDPGGGVRTAGGLLDGIVVALSDTGTYAADYLVQSPGTEQLNAVSVLPDGTVFVAGTLGGDGDLGGGARTAAGVADGLIVSLDASLHYRWDVVLGGTHYDGVTALHAAPDGSLVAAGQFSGTLTLAGTPHASRGENDLFVLFLRD